MLHTRYPSSRRIRKIPLVESKIIIFYCPGSRGDFLAAVLTDQIELCYENYSLNNLNVQYQKMHSIDKNTNPFNSEFNEESISSHGIRIKLAPNDYQIIVQLIENKHLTKPFSEYQVEHWENQHCVLDSKFKFIVHFADLFDINFLKEFYQQFNGRPMPAKLVPMIEYNIALQFNYTPLLRTRFQIDQHLLDR